MKRWQAILCSMCLSFFPACLGMIGYVLTFINGGYKIEFWALPLPLVFGAICSYIIYFDFKNFVKN